MTRKTTKKPAKKAPRNVKASKALAPQATGREQPVFYKDLVKMGLSTGVNKHELERIVKPHRNFFTHIDVMRAAARANGLQLKEPPQRETVKGFKRKLTIYRLVRAA